MAEKKVVLSAKVKVLAIVVVAWVILDQVTKGVFAGMQPGETLGSLLGGLVDLRLVHNTGAAWGVFSGNTLLLGGFSLIVVVLLLIYFFWDLAFVNGFQTLGVALVVGGGIGNAIDRFTQGYVTDFLAVTFIDFPVFNVADIGVTCGMVILIIGFILEWRAESAKAAADADDGKGGAR